MKTHARILPAALLLALNACGDDANPTSSSATAGNTTGTASDTDSASGDTPPGTETTVEPTTGDPSTSTTSDDTTGDPATSTTTGDDTTGGTTHPIDPCDECAADASCDGGQCVCNDGFDGDGQTCADIDECAAQNDCDVDATCTNNPGGYDCACNPGYKGNGFDCENIDECTQDLDDCDANATCTDQDGTFKCACNEGFMGDGKTCFGDKAFGEPCMEGAECASGLCLLGGDGQCTVTCTQVVANDCGAQDVTGLCVNVGNDQFVCAGPLTFGTDPDDTVIQNEDQLMRMFQSKTDSDLFLVKLPAGTYVVTATPDLDDDIQLEFYNDGDASEIGTLNNGGIGIAEAGQIDSPGGVFFVVARNIGASNGNYKLQITKQ